MAETSSLFAILGNDALWLHHWRARSDFKPLTPADRRPWAAFKKAGCVPWAFCDQKIQDRSAHVCFGAAWHAAEYTCIYYICDIYIYIYIYTLGSWAWASSGWSLQLGADGVTNVAITRWLLSLCLLVWFGLVHSPTCDVCVTSCLPPWSFTAIPEHRELVGVQVLLKYLLRHHIFLSFHCCPLVCFLPRGIRLQAFDPGRPKTLGSLQEGRMRSMGLL